MAILVIEHLNASELPVHWAEQLKALPGQTVTVRIETDDTTSRAADAQAQPHTDGNALFGMWRDRGEMADVAGYVCKLRAAD